MQWFFLFFALIASGFLNPAFGATGSIETNSPCILTPGAASCSIDVKYIASGAPVYCLWDISSTPKKRWTCQGYSSYEQKLSATTSPTTFVLKAQQGWGDDSDATFNAGQTLTTVSVNAVSNDASSPPQNQSAYNSLLDDVVVSSEKFVLLQNSVNLKSADNILVQSDGRYFLSSGSVAALMQVYVDGKPIGNESVIDWRNSNSIQQHSFNSIGAIYLSAGRHTIQLIGSVIGGNGSFAVGANSNLSTFVHPAENLLASEMKNDTAPIDLDTSAWDSKNTIAPAYPGLNIASIVTRPNPGDIVAISSGRVYKYGADGDALLKIYENGVDPGNNYSSSSMQDVCTCAETQAPFYSHAFLPGRTASTEVSLNASEGPWYQKGISDPASYRIGATSSILVMHGGLQVAGSGPMVLNNNTSTKAANSINQPWFWTCIATTTGASGCSDVGSSNIIASEKINIPINHHGNIMFSAKARIQGDPADAGGTVFLYITIDGKQMGSIGVQSLGGNGASISERTITASYFATGTEKLSSGDHLVQVYAVGNGSSYKNLSMAQTLPLVWFD